MLQGAIIGLVVGLIMVGVRFYQQSQGAKSILGALATGGIEARAALDKWQAPIHGKVPASKLIKYLERVAWLAVIGDLQALQEEGTSFDGGLSVVTQLQALAVAGLLGHRDDAGDIDGMERIAGRIESEGGAMLGLVKKNTLDLRAMSRSIGGLAMDPDARQRLLGRVRQSGPAQKIVLLRLIAKATERAGEDPSGYHAQVAQILAKH